jgi:multiple sugar transport system permease protein
MSLKSFRDIVSYPPKFIFTLTLDNYREVLFDGKSLSDIHKMPEFIQYVLNSCITSFGAVALSLVLGLPAAYVLTRDDSRKNKKIASNFMSYRFAPELAILLPLFTIYKVAGLYDTFFGLILAHQLITLPMIIWIMMGFFRDCPRELSESAQIDGANVWVVFFKIILPIVKPGIFSALILAFVFSWNNLLFGLILSGGNTMPVTMGILQAMTFDQIKWGEMAASAVISAIPGIVIALCCQKFLIKGLTMGAVKS